MGAREQSAYLTDAEFRERYIPLLDHFTDWRTRLNKALGLDPLGSMETAVAAAERLTGLARVASLPDPRDPDPSRPGIFRDHNCWKCGDGARPCVVGNPNQCEHPHARND